MKKTFSLSLAVLVILVSLSSCGQQKRVEKVAHEFLSAIVRMDFETARKYSAEDSLDEIRLVETVIEMLPEEKIQDLRRGRFIIEKVAVFENTAQVFYNTPEEGQHILELEKIEGKWLVHWKQEL